MSKTRTIPHNFIARENYDNCFLAFLMRKVDSNYPIISNLLKKTNLKSVCNKSLHSFPSVYFIFLVLFAHPSALL